MNKIGLVVFWFGKLPPYFPFFLKGCEHNKSVLDIHIFSDQKIPETSPSNVFLHITSWLEFQKILSDRLGTNVIVKNPFKLCDFRPMFGLVFEEYLKPYEFWGYGDIDVIYGDLQKYIPAKILDKYDVLTFREFIISGAFTILRNNDYTRTLFRKSPDLDFVFSSEEYVSFDEAGRKRAMCRKRIPAYELHYIDNFVCWTSIVQSEDDKGILKLYARDYLKESLPYNSCLFYSHGEIKITQLDEVIGYHLVTEKRNREFVIPTWKHIDDFYYITPTGFYKKNNYLYWLVSRCRRFLGNSARLEKRIIDIFNYRIAKI